MKQKPWDRYEAALLLSYCLKIEAGDIPRKEAVDIVSNTLRKRAEVQGVEIDETFRNTNGISMQMSAIRNCYLGKDHGLAGSKLFHEMVDLYKSNHDALEQKVKDTSWHFFAVLALARTDEEAQTFRNMIKKTIGNAEYKNILVIDALSSPLGLELFEEYVSYSAMSMYYNGNNNQQSKDNARKAREVLDRTWRDRIHDGSFIVWSYANQDGEKATGANAVHTIMQTVVLNRYNHVPDFTKGLTESQLKNTQTKQVAKYGFGLSDVKGLIAGCEKTVLGKVWNRDTYWSDQELEKEPISIIKRSVDKLIHEAFRENGRISIDEICELLETAYGFAPCNLTAFVLGFLLKEYKGDPFRSQDSEGLRESMTPDKLSEMIGNYYSKKAKTT